MHLKHNINVYMIFHIKAVNNLVWDFYSIVRNCNVCMYVGWYPICYISNYIVLRNCGKRNVKSVYSHNQGD